MFIPAISILGAFLRAGLSHVMPASVGTALAFNEVLARYGLAPIDAVTLQADIGRWRTDVRGRMSADLTVVTVGEIIMPVSVDLWSRFVFHARPDRQHAAMLDLRRTVFFRTLA